jgi:carbohydrate diacid regulator
MISIEPALAQEIVERTMKIIAFNVNVMNAHGVIIGSGDASRVGELHSGAQLALAQRRTVEITTSDTRNLHGGKPGVNLPLTVRGQMCGVVGLTGEPDTVRQFGELVRVTAEMILEQAQLIGELQREKRYREEFVFNLVEQGNTSRADLEAWAARLGIDFISLRAVVVLNLIDENLRPDLAQKELQNCQTQLSAQRPEILTAATSSREMVILETFSATDFQSTRLAFAHKRLLDLHMVLQKVLETPFVLSMGVALAGIEGVELSYQSARQTFRVGRIRDPQETMLTFYSLSLPVLLAGLGSGWQAEQLRRPLQCLNAFDKRTGTLRHTIDVWFAHNGHSVATANALHIHRNTLDYRLRQISEVTGLDLTNTDDRMLLYIAMQLE